MIPRELIKKLRKIEIYTSRLANDQLAGSYHSVFKGRGMAFSEVRQYQPGDDVRFIDWNVSARMSEPYVKMFTEEREMTVMLLVDLSASERFGSVGRPKIEAVAEVAALLAFSAIKNNDRVGLILFTDKVERVGHRAGSRVAGQGYREDRIAARGTRQGLTVRRNRVFHRVAVGSQIPRRKCRRNREDHSTGRCRTVRTEIDREVLRNEGSVRTVRAVSQITRSSGQIVFVQDRRAIGTEVQMQAAIRDVDRLAGFRRIAVTIR